MACAVAASGDLSVANEAPAPRDPRVSDAESWVMVEAEAAAEAARNSVTATQNGGVDDEAEQLRLAAKAAEAAEAAEVEARAAEEEAEARELAEAEAVVARMDEEEKVAREEQEEKDRLAAFSMANPAEVAAAQRMEAAQDHRRALVPFALHPPPPPTSPPPPRDLSERGVRF